MCAGTQVSLREVLDPLSLSMAGVVDPQVEYVAPEVPREVFVSTLQVNKLSREYLAETGFDEAGADQDETHRRLRTQRLEDVTELFDEAGVEFASMKNLLTPKSMMSDIDFLFSDPSHEARAARVLTEDGYELMQFRLLAHPMKTMPVKPDDEGRPGMPGEHDRPVDLYPDAIWIRKRVCDPSTVVDRSEDKGWHNPTPEDDLYLVATHAYSHLSLRYAELYHGVLLLEEADSFDWEYLLSVASDYGCEDALYIYLRLLDEYLAATERERIPPRVFQSLEETWVCGIASRWFERQTRPRVYPVEFPIWLANGVSAAYHTPRIVGKSTFRESLKDFQSHLLVASSKLITGDT